MNSESRRNVIHIGAGALFFTSAFLGTVAAYEELQRSRLVSEAVQYRDIGFEVQADEIEKSAAEHEDPRNKALGGMALTGFAGGIVVVSSRLRSRPAPKHENERQS